MAWYYEILAEDDVVLETSEAVYASQFEAQYAAYQRMKEKPSLCLRKFRASWPNKNLAAGKKLEATRAFFRFCHISGWISTNPAAALKPGKVTDPQIIPITKDEFKAILAACHKYPNRLNRGRLKAMILAMRFTVLRIRDVVTL